MPAPRLRGSIRFDFKARLFYAFQETNLLTGFQQQITNERQFATIDIFNSPFRPDFVSDRILSA